MLTMFTPKAGEPLRDDWFPLSLPTNIAIGDDVYIDTTYGFAPFRSTRRPGLILGDSCGAYDRSTFVVGPSGLVEIGAFTCLNGVYLICQERISIGAHGLIAWGVVLADSWCDPHASEASRRERLRRSAATPHRPLPNCGRARPIHIEENVWIGFGSVILPGVRLGRGCVVGCRSVIREDVPPYGVVAGDPPRLLRVLNATDSEDARRQAIAELTLSR
jgi:acetyltransferase-like isoleucine patch superfamily enzyme